MLDLDVSWSLPCRYTTGESEDEPLGEDYDEGVVIALAQINNSPTAADSPQGLMSLHNNMSQRNGATDRKASGTTSSNTVNSSSITTSPTGPAGGLPSGSKNVSPVQYMSPKALVKVAQSVSACNPQEIAEQITKMQSELFMQIEVWIRNFFGTCPKLSTSLGNGYGMLWGILNQTQAPILLP
jgi:hypothetical protein